MHHGAMKPMPLLSVFVALAAGLVGGYFWATADEGNPLDPHSVFYGRQEHQRGARPRTLARHLESEPVTTDSLAARRRRMTPPPLLRGCCDNQRKTTFPKIPPPSREHGPKPIPPLLRNGSPLFPQGNCRRSPCTTCSINGLPAHPSWPRSGFAVSRKALRETKP